MNRRDFLRRMGTVGMLAGLGLPAKGETAPARPPNFVLILADDLGYGDVGCYGNTRYATPRIDQLAAEGARFTDFHSNGPVCSPTRAALMTGCYQQRCGIEGVVTAKNHRDTGLPLSATTFAEALQPAGYATGLFGKWHLGYAERFNPVAQGFDCFRGYVSGNVDYHSHIDQEGYEDWWRGRELRPEEGYSTDLITEHAVRFIEARHEAPFCCYIAHEAPHYPYQGRDDQADRAPGRPGPVRGSREDRDQAYAEMVRAMDEGVGRVVDTLRRLGLAENTLVVFMSDNGACREGSNAPLRGYKASLWEGGHRVPAMAWWPGRIQPGRVIDGTAMTMDLFPTMTALAGTGTSEPEQCDGVPLVPALLEGNPLPGRTLFWRFRNQAAVREGPWKLLVRRGKGGSEALHLFNLAEDLGETHGLSEKAPDRVAALREKLRAWEREVAEGVSMRT